MPGLCQYADFFGKVGEGVHSYRIFDIAVVDLIMTIIAAYIIFKVLPVDILKKLPKGLEFLTILIILLVIGIIMHRMFCVNTTVDKFIAKYLHI